MSKQYRVILIFFLLFFSLKLFAQKDDLKITYKRNSDKSVDFYYTKSSPGSLYLLVGFTKSENFKDPKFKSVIDSYSGFLFKIEPTNENEQIRFAYRFKTVRGIPNPKADSLFAYTLPFKAGDSLILNNSENFREKYLEVEKPDTWKAFAIYSKKSDTVRSIRKGIVVNIGNKHNSDTTVDKEFSTKVNRVIVEHSDGTLAYYFGFKKDSFLVEEGQVVYPQTPLGTLGLFNKDNYVLVFYINHLTTKKEGSKTKFSRTYINPYFYTSKDLVQLEENTKHFVEFDESILIKEFSKKELKKYKKNKKLFD